ncbi:MAG: ArsC family reductase [Pseudomonadota bacterium]
MTDVILYGIKNCDSVKKARKWLDAHDISYHFHDFRVDGCTADLLDKWAKSVDWEILLNRRGTTWRQLDETDKSDVNQTKAQKLMLKNPTLIKRPVMVTQDTVTVGFKDSNYASLLS